MLLHAMSAPMVPLAAVWKGCTSPIAATLRFAGLCAKPITPPDVDMSGRVVIVTGANTGVGNRVALHFARMGAKVIMACRSVARGEEARAKLEQEIRMSSAAITNNTDANVPGGQGTTNGSAGSLQVMECDLSSLDSVYAFAKTFKAEHGDQLDVLVNNAGIGEIPIGGSRVTADGLNLIFGVNFVGHFALTMELLPLIKATPSARVICLASVLHHFGCTDWESACGGHQNLYGRSVYADSKLAMVLFAKELRRQFAAAGSSATAFSVNPGAVSSDIWRFIPRIVKPIFDLLTRLFFVNVEEGCCTTVCASALPLKELSGSEYYQPYWLPFSWPFPFEFLGIFLGCAPGKPSLPKDEPKASAELWSTCERVIAAARAAKGQRAATATALG